MIGLDSQAKTVLLKQIRCPTCGRRQCDAFLTGESFLVIQCRCHAKFRVDPKETFLITAAASVTRSFDGRNYNSFGFLMK